METPKKKNISNGFLLEIIMSNFVQSTKKALGSISQGDASFTVILFSSNQDQVQGFPGSRDLLHHLPIGNQSCQPRRVKQFSKGVFG